MTREEAISVLENPDVSIGVIARIGQDQEYWRKLKPALDMAISALLQHGVPDKDVGKNDPLTLDELRKMDGDPVWVVWPDGRIKSQWFIVGSTFWIDMFVEWDGKLSWDYGKTWLAYSQKPEDGTR